MTGSSAHGAEQGTGARAAPNSILSSASTPGSDSGNASPLGDQTPFSVFFSATGQGPGTESAASVLPRMVLPANGSALRASHAPGSDAPSAALQTGSSQSGLRPNAGTPNPKDLSSGTESGTSQNAQPQRAEADLSAAASVPALSPQLTAVPAAAPTTAAAVTVPVSGAPAPVVSSLPQAAPAPLPPSPTTLAAPEAPALGAVQAAQLINRAVQSEMRIGLNTSAFGTVEVRTTVRTSDVGLVIGSEKGDLRTLLANDMPAITNALQQQNLRLNSVNFMQGFAFSNNASGGGGSGSEQRSFVPMRPSADSTLSDAAPENSADAQPTTRWGGASISILA